jgi:hypothetical protein
MAVIFNQPVKQGRLQLIPGVALAFKDERAEDYFVACGWAEKTKDKAVHTYPVGSLTYFNEAGEEVPGIDPATVFGSGDNAGRQVLEG